MVVEIEEIFFHCAKAFLRSGLWKPETWEPEARVPRRAVIAKEVEPSGMTVEQLDDYYEPRELRQGPLRLMPYEFLKGHGTENDFVLLPDLDGTVHGELSTAASGCGALCDRRAGIGGDGVLRVVRVARTATPSGSWTTATPTARSRRCAATASGCSSATWSTHGLADGSAPIPVDTRDGVKTLTVDGDLITVDMGTPKVLGETTVGVERTSPGRPATSTWATRTRWRSSTRSTRPGRCSSRRRTTRRSTPTASTSSSSYAAASGTSRCGCTSAAPGRPAPAAPAPAR